MIEKNDVRIIRDMKATAAKHGLKVVEADE